VVKVNNATIRFKTGEISDIIVITSLPEGSRRKKIGCKFLAEFVE
jgi:hypothetical protein